MSPTDLQRLLDGQALVMRSLLAILAQLNMDTDNLELALKAAAQDHEERLRELSSA